MEVMQYENNETMESVSYCTAAWTNRNACLFSLIYVCESFNMLNIDKCCPCCGYTNANEP